MRWRERHTPATVKTPILGGLSPEFSENIFVRSQIDRFADVTKIAAMTIWLPEWQDGVTPVAKPVAELMRKGGRIECHGAVKPR